MRRKLLLIGWDAADWQIINPLLDGGKMPHLARLIEGGVMGNLATLRPVLSPMLWNSIATGKRAAEHGVFGFTEPDPQTGGVRPVSSTSRKVKALWNILTQQGLKAHVVNWFAGHPAEPINGVAVSPVFAHAVAPVDQPWPIGEGVVHPKELAATLADLRLHPGELDASAILPLVPRAAEVDQEKDTRLATIAKLLAENCSVHNAATWILENREWDFAAVYYDGIDHFSHVAMQFHPPRLPWIPEDQFEIYQHVVTGAYRFHDMMLGRLLELAGEDTTVLLCSDHGFFNNHLRPTGVPDEPAGPAAWHRQFGVICLKGPGIKKDERIYGAGLLDIAPTVLTLFGLPPAADMPGKVLADAWESPPAVERIPSWEDVPGECGMHPQDLRMEPEQAKALIDQFVALGYMQKPDGNADKALTTCIQECRANQARDLMDAGRIREAIPILEELHAELPKRTRLSLDLADAYLRTGRHAEALQVLESIGPEEAGSATRAYLLGIAAYAQRRTEDALGHFRDAESANPRLPHLHVGLGRTYLRLKRNEDAERAFRRALEIDGDSAAAWTGLARVGLRQKRWEDAASSALTSVGLLHFQPVAHYALGAALVHLGYRDRAYLALDIALKQRPGLIPARRLLISMLRHDGRFVEAATHLTATKKILSAVRRGVAEGAPA